MLSPRINIIIIIIPIENTSPSPIMFALIMECFDKPNINLHFVKKGYKHTKTFENNT